ncbi:MAG: DUF1207 domain-containing protein [Planctomycetaceae bacterium]
MIVTRCSRKLAAAFCWGMLGIASLQPVAAQEGWSPVAFEESGDIAANDARIAQISEADNSSRAFEPMQSPDFIAAPPPLQAPAQYDPNINPPNPQCLPEYPTWQFLPDGLMYKSYLAGPLEPRFANVWLHEQDKGWLWDVTLGGRVGIWRYGTTSIARPQGWQLDVEGAAMPRLDVEHQEDMESVNFRFGVPLTWAQGPWQMKFGYYHLSAHVGDEFLISHPGFERVNYVRDSVIFGVGYFLTNDLRIYGETAGAFHHSVAEPWEFQFGFEYSPAVVNTGLAGIPFFAANVQLFEEQDFGGALNTMVGWQWRSGRSNRLLRAGLQYFNGKSSQFAFYNEHEELLGLGLWLDQ